ncbi:MAG: class I SAM-dependent RNA methyltransferase [Eubacteriaceae bacterium]|nr:class I SAM-dependent RNA methyltransferase [Eubacteriaceae bacterium]
MQIVATCASGLEAALKYELKSLGYSYVPEQQGHFMVQGSWDDVYKLNVMLRCANRVLVLVGSAKAESFDELFDLAYSLEWQDFLPKTASLAIARVSSSRSKLFSKSDCQRIAMKAVCEKLLKAYRINALPESGPFYPINIGISNDIASFYLDTSGESLHKRGYSIDRGQAPIKETIAAGILNLARYKGEREFADIMCGSGTFAIEAALIATGKPPGANRGFAFISWEKPSQTAIEHIEMLSKEMHREPEYRILASDINPKAIVYAKQNAERAGVLGNIKFQVLDCKDFRSRKAKGLIAVNPPYGQRLGDGNDAHSAARDLSAAYSSLSGWDLFALSAYEGFEAAFGQKADKNRKLYSGGMRAYLYQYFG